MDEPKSLDSLFKEKIFRIPDYQRGYAWQREQLKDFWEDLINLSGDRSHYTGQLTLRQVPAREVAESDKEYWLVEDHSYTMYHIVDGQQRLTTFVIFLQAFVELFQNLPQNLGKANEAVYVNESLNIAELEKRFLFKTKPTGDRFRTYKFGYTVDNPSYNYLRFNILREEGAGSLEETFYTLNLSNAKTYFVEQLRELHEREGIQGLQEVYKKLTKRFLFNEYVIKDAFDVFVAFETMNNRGKKLSDLELLKNRLIYLTTLYDLKELDAAERRSLRDAINDAWKEVYHQLGRNKTRPLNDDDFLRAHWTMYFKYSRKTGRDYIHFLLDEQFTPKAVHKKVEREVTLMVPQEQRSDSEVEELEEESSELPAETPIPVSQLRPTVVKEYVNSLKASAVHWFNTFYPELANGMTDTERHWIDGLNRVGMVYFRPLVMAILKNEPDVARRIEAFKKIERFIFIAFRLMSARANYRSSEFYNLARAVDKAESSVETLTDKLDEALQYTFNDDGTLKIDELIAMLQKKVDRNLGYYGWPGLRYFLYEYELSLLAASRQKKIDWSDLLRAEKDRISIEHIYPQTETVEWAQCFASVSPDDRWYFNLSLGNLLILSMSINSSLQNDKFDDKKRVQINASGQKIRNGYQDGSHSEIEVSREPTWGPAQIRERGLKLLRFMEERWSFRLRDDDRERLLLLPQGQQKI